MYTYRKPKNAQHAAELVKLANVNVKWDICNPSNMEMSQKYFEAYEPIVFIYKNDALVGGAHRKGDRPTVIDLNDRDVTSTYNKLVLNEIDTELKQLELF
jgi:hypothetical protein